MGTRDRSSREWLWEEVAALKRGRPAPETPAGHEETAETAHIVREALDVSLDPERQALSRERLARALRDEPALPAVVVTPGMARSPVAALVEMLVSAAVILVVGLAGWYLPAWGEHLAMKEDAPVGYRAPAWESRFYVGSFRVLASDRNLRDEFGGARGLLRPH